MCRLSHNRTQEVRPAKRVERLHLTTPKHGNVLGRAMPQTRARTLKTIKSPSKVELSIEISDGKWLSRTSRNEQPTLLNSNLRSKYQKTLMVSNFALMTTILLCWPRNCANKLRPLDKSGFCTFEAHYDPPLHLSSKVSKFTPCRHVSKVEL
jgi:hypothetical protein